MKSSSSSECGVSAPTIWADGTPPATASSTGAHVTPLFWLRHNPPQLDWFGGWWWPPYDVDPDSPICKSAAVAYEAVLNEPAKYYGFTAVDDATFLNQAGIPTITLGPGSIELAHTANEYIEIKDLLDAAKIYALTIVDWCGV